MTRKVYADTSCSHLNGAKWNLFFGLISYRNSVRISQWNAFQDSSQQVSIKLTQILEVKARYQ
jgi:hypothetical protein